MRTMSQEEIEYATLKNAIRIIATMCAANEDMIIDKLTGFTWDENEAEGIKKSDGLYHVIMEDD